MNHHHDHQSSNIFFSRRRYDTSLKFNLSRPFNFFFLALFVRFLLFSSCCFACFSMNWNFNLDCVSIIPIVKSGSMICTDAVQFGKKKLNGNLYLSIFRAGMQYAKADIIDSLNWK